MCFTFGWVCSFSCCSNRQKLRDGGQFRSCFPLNDEKWTPYGENKRIIHHWTSSKLKKICITDSFEIEFTQPSLRFILYRNEHLLFLWADNHKITFHNSFDLCLFMEISTLNKINHCQSNEQRTDNFLCTHTRPTQIMQFPHSWTGNLEQSWFVLFLLLYSGISI